MSNFIYFNDSEIAGLDTGLVAMLDRARHRAGIPLTITSGLRTSETNTDPNAVKDSAHLTGHAVDLRCEGSRYLWKMLDGLFFAGFKRIGIYFKIIDGKVRTSHLHVDTDMNKDLSVVWLTVEK